MKTWRVGWLVVGIRIRCEGSGFVENEAELRTTTLFKRGTDAQRTLVHLGEWTSTRAGTTTFIHVSMGAPYGKPPLSFDNAVPGQAFCGRITLCSQCHRSP